jgi:ankyrin repeat protein
VLHAAAAESGDLEALQLLLCWTKEAQLKPDELSELLLAKNYYGHTVLHAASRSGNLET